MPDSTKRKIVIASVLKPADDTRMYEKLGVSLSDRFEVHIIGQRSTCEPSSGIAFHPIFNFKRTGPARLFAGWKMFFKILSIKPGIVIVTTPELLWVGVIHKIFFRRSLYYDVLENYYWNILDSHAYPVIIRTIVASMVRLTEIISSVFVDKFFLAEKRYATELSFAKPHLILQNKLPKSIAEKYPIRKPKRHEQLLFTGTLAQNTGVFQAIEIASNLHQIDPSIRLTIVGYCHVDHERKRLLKLVDENSFITLVGGDQLVPHTEILKHIAQSDYGIIVYPPNLGTFTSIPTKLFEYLALQLPILAWHNPETHELVEKFDAGIILEPNPDYNKLVRLVQKAGFTCHQSDEIYWEDEAKSLISAIY